MEENGSVVRIMSRGSVAYLQVLLARDESKEGKKRKT